MWNSTKKEIISSIKRCEKDLCENYFEHNLIDKGIEEDYVIYLSLDDLSNNYL